MAAGLLLVEPGGRVLLLKRSESIPLPGLWVTPGGGVEPGETRYQGALRETWEEAGYDASGLAVDEHYRTPTTTGAKFHTFVVPVAQAFEPVLNWESQDWAWVRPHAALGMDLHPGVRLVVGHHFNLGE